MRVGIIITYFFVFLCSDQKFLRQVEEPLRPIGWDVMEFLNFSYKPEFHIYFPIPVKEYFAL